MGLSNNLGKLSNMITSTGSAVGIAQASPSYTLDVSGTGYFSGIVGIGVAPSAWYNSSGYATLQVGNASLFGRNSANSELYLSSNAYDNTSGNPTYITTDFAARYVQNDGVHSWLTAPSGTAGTATTFTERMRITQAGNVGIGTSNAPVGNLNIQGGSPQYIVLTNTAADGVTDAIQGGIIGQARGYGNNLAQMASILFRNKPAAPWYKGEITFNTNDTDGTDPATSPTERMRITSAGQIYNSNAPSADWGMRIFGSSVSGSSYGMEILGGTTSGDISFAVSPRNGSVYYFRVLGNGDIKSVPVYNNSTSNSANMYIFSDGSFSRSTSSLRFKTDVETLDNNISETIYKMRPIWYRSLCEKDRRDWSWYGFGAEELAKLEPRLVHWGYKKEDYVINEETKEQELKEGAELQADGVQYERITVLLVAEMQKMNNAIQELSAQNQNLKSRLDKAGL